MCPGDALKAFILINSSPNESHLPSQNYLLRALVVAHTGRRLGVRAQVKCRLGDSPATVPVETLVSAQAAQLERSSLLAFIFTETWVEGRAL